MGRLIFLLAMVAFVPAHATSPGAADDDIVVRVEIRGRTVIVNVEAPVAASKALTWEVLTDYAHMTSFFPNLRVSEILRRQGNVLEVHQIGEVRKGPLHFAFDNVRAIELLPPDEIRSRLVQGDFKFYEFRTRIVERPGGVVIINHGECVPNHWVPPLIGPALIAAETRKQYGELRTEILRRRDRR